jgi:diguanylate cyclase (GGDEF)-like protein/PAS domain S-box-containing protein
MTQYRLHSVEGQLLSDETDSDQATDSEYGALIERLPVPVLLTDRSCERVLYANPPAARLWEVERYASFPALLDRMHLLAADAALVTELWEQRRALPLGPEGVESHLLLRDGRQVRWQTSPCPDDSGMGRGLLHVFQETAPEEPAARAAPTDDLFRLTFEKAAVGMALISPDFRMLRANPSFCLMLGYDEAELRELCLLDMVDPEEGEPDSGWASGLTSGQQSFHLDRRFLRRDGQRVWVHLSVSVVRDASGRPVYYVAMAEDTTERKRAEEERDRQTRELQALATTDPLTGLYNHRYMHEYLGHRLLEARRTGQPVSVLMLDLDHFRALNEDYGHDVGDRALRSVADTMRHALRGQDVACRYGGEEFVMILAGAPFRSALAAAERVRRRVEAIRPLVVDGRAVTCSVGVATYPVHASTAASLLKAADIALYEAKRGGRNRIQGYQPVAVEVTPQIEKLTSGLNGASLEAVNALVTAIDLRDRYTGAHCQRVARVSLELAIHLSCSDAEIETLRLGASLLDVGKIGLPDQILTKPGRLTREEWALMREHPIWGEQLLRRSALPPEVLQLVRWHHERLDGSGYPDALQADDIPLLVRIVSIADVATALRDDRPHRRAWPRARVTEYLQRHAGATLDERVVGAYCELYGG